MKPTTRVVHVLAILLAVTGTLAEKANATLSFANLRLDATSFSIAFSGDLPSGSPSFSIFFENPSLSTSPGFALGDFENAEDWEFTGVQTVADVLIGGEFFGDYVVVNFNSDLSAGEPLEGILTATWSTPFFAPSEVSALDIYWGQLSSLGGVQLATGVPTVPKPGDFDADGHVEGFDFLLWQRDPSVGNLADWEMNFGISASLLAASATVPEPTTCTLALAALCLVMSRRRV